MGDIRECAAVEKVPFQFFRRVDFGESFLRIEHIQDIVDNKFPYDEIIDRRVIALAGFPLHRAGVYGSAVAVSMFSPRGGRQLISAFPTEYNAGKDVDVCAFALFPDRIFLSAVFFEDEKHLFMLFKCEDCRVVVWYHYPLIFRVYGSVFGTLVSVVSVDTSIEGTGCDNPNSSGSPFGTCPGEMSGGIEHPGCSGK